MDFYRVFSGVCALAIMIGLSSQSALAEDARTIGELHPPVIASLGDQKITVFFLKNNLKGKVVETHVPYAEIFYSPINVAKPSLNYVWKIEGEQIASVFFYERTLPDRAQKSMYVLMRSKASNAGFEGVSYSVMELPLIKNGDELSVAFFTGDQEYPALQNCNDGRDLTTGKEVVCPYKDAASIKKYLASVEKGVSDLNAPASTPVTTFHPSKGVEATLALNGSVLVVGVKNGSRAESKTIDFEAINELHIQVDDFNFDGKKDFAVWQVDDGMGTYTVSRIFVYQPESGSFKELRPDCGDGFVNLRIERARKALLSTYWEMNKPKGCVTKFSQT
ncbi:hypothetical protein RHM58_07515 [Pseudomonas sp. 10S4]|uniref:XAC2610-related protein n=2 Tax=Pseudomonas sp. 10S4 TaxID=3048583 RepID=UPI002AC991F0|nr:MULTISPECIES: hypothetical protein [unclassified Pseudomonas]MEB0225359.1 hypothetical protein [Pseudomonas sp. 5S1]WPX19814.1 hypothetical protein RHM58_07515 [Pseudomonas sp. 10S4]